MSAWIDRHYRSLMLAAMGLELVFLAALVVMEGILLWRK